MAGHNWKGNSRLEDMERRIISCQKPTSSYKEWESRNDNNRLPKARKLFLSNIKSCRSNNRNRTKLSSWMHVSLFLQMSESCRCTAEQDIVHSLQLSSYLEPLPMVNQREAIKRKWGFLNTNSDPSSRRQEQMEGTNRQLSVLQENSLSGGQILRWPRADAMKKQGGIKVSLFLCHLINEAVSRHI